MEMEDVVMLHPGVKMAAVVGVPDVKFGQAARAFIVPKRGEIW